MYRVVCSGSTNFCRRISHEEVHCLLLLAQHFVQKGEN